MSSSLRVPLLVVFAMLAFASNSLLCRIALRDTEIDAASFTAIRLASGALMLIVLLRARGVRPSSGGSWPMALMLFAYAAFFSFAYRDLTAATGALLLFGAVQLTMTAWGLWQGERIAGGRQDLHARQPPGPVGDRRRAPPDPDREPIITADP